MTVGLEIATKELFIMGHANGNRINSIFYVQLAVFRAFFAFFFRRVGVSVILVIIVCGLANFMAGVGPVQAGTELEPPFIQSPEFKKYLDDQKKLTAEIESLTAEETRLEKAKSELRLDLFGADFIKWFGDFFLPNSWYGPLFQYYNWPITILWVVTILSLLLIIIYLQYLKHYNPLKWFLLFQSKLTWRFIVESIRGSHRISLLIICLLMLFPSVAWAETSTLTDIGYYLYGVEFQKNYITTKYAKNRENLTYSSYNGLSLFPTFTRGSYEHKYNYLAHRIFLEQKDITYGDFKSLFENCSSPNCLLSVYNLMFTLPDNEIKKFYQDRLRTITLLSSKSLKTKIIELEIINNCAETKNKLSVIAADMIDVLTMLVAGAQETADIFNLADLISYYQPDQAVTLFKKIAWRWPDFMKNEIILSKFEKVYRKLSRANPDLYNFADLSTQTQGYSDTVKAMACLLFQNLNEPLVSATIKLVRLESVTWHTFKNRVEFAQMIKQYRPVDIDQLFRMLVEFQVKIAGFNLPDLSALFTALGLDRTVWLDALVTKDQELFDDQADKSSLIDRDFISVLTASDMSKYLFYFKKRLTKAAMILPVLFEKEFQTFLEFLDFVYANNPTLLTNMTFPNKWRISQEAAKFISAHDLGKFKNIRYEMYLVAKETTTAVPDTLKIQYLLKPVFDSIYTGFIINDGNLNDQSFLYAVLTSNLIRNIGNNLLKNDLEMLDHLITLRLKKEMTTNMVGLTSKVNSLKESNSSLVDRIKTLKNEIFSAKTRFYTPFFLLCLLLTIVSLYIVSAFFYSLKFAFISISSYSDQKILLFISVFMETFAKFMMAVIIYTPLALTVILAVQLFGFWTNKNREFPNIRRSYDRYTGLTLKM
ncbi:MAG: hypothetical protein HQK55_02345 [Deltaproteobacteria bacterium]|nr:hypothetical protein [Deltaproteobacteria bacterium]